jgi:choline dehydrogenase-like flavoprotein
LLDQPLFNLALVGRARSFRQLKPAERERLLQALAVSRWRLLRAGFQGIKRLAAFLFYSVSDERGQNPAWPALGYAPSANPPAVPAALAVTVLDQPTTLAADVCVIGSGAGGAVVAAELAAAGRRVVVLEAGSGRQAPDFDQRELTGMNTLYLDHGMTASRDLGLAILAGATLGGGTAVNWQTCLPTPDSVRAEWAEVSGCPHFADASFSRSVEAVMERIHAGTRESVVNQNNAVLQRGCDKLGYHWTVLSRNARGCDPDQCGYCVFGCRQGGKQSTAVTFLADAQRQGDMPILVHCRAERVRIVNGRAAGVEAIATDEVGHAHPVRIEAPVVVVAAGAIHSPALLLRSGLRLPALGRNLFLHPTSAVTGRYDEPVEAWRGPPQTILCDQFANLAAGYGFRLETAPAHPGLIALALPWADARSHRRLMQRTASASSIIVLTRDHQGGRVRLGPGRRPLVEYRPGAREQAHLRQGIVEAIRVHLAAGAREVCTLHTRPLRLERDGALSVAEVEAFCQRAMTAPVAGNWSTLFSAHQMGTCRMGRDARTAVCDANGEVFGVRGLFIADGSAFPASSGVNPMVTIMALAHHTAQGIKGR